MWEVAGKEGRYSGLFGAAETEPAAQIGDGIVLAYSGIPSSRPSFRSDRSVRRWHDSATEHGLCHAHFHRIRLGMPECAGDLISDRFQ